MEFGLVNLIWASMLHLRRLFIDEIHDLLQTLAEPNCRSFCASNDQEALQFLELFWSCAGVGQDLHAKFATIIVWFGSSWTAALTATIFSMLRPCVSSLAQKHPIVNIMTKIYPLSIACLVALLNLRPLTHKFGSNFFIIFKRCSVVNFTMIKMLKLIEDFTFADPLALKSNL